MEKPIKSHEDDSCENIQNGISNLVFKHVRIIQETIFNLSCPNCKKAFLEFEGCAAVTCGNCKAGFCGLCLEHCGTDAHQHVYNCVKNREKSVYVTKPALDAAHLDMRNQKLREYLQPHRFNAKVQQQIIEKIRKDLIDLGMNVPVVSGGNEDAGKCSDSVMRHVREIQEKILTLSCPTCEAVFFDVDGRAAVTCDSCRMEFCGLCLDYANVNVRTHVLSCKRNSMKGRYFFDSAELSKIHAAVRTDRIQSYFDDKIPDRQTKVNVAFSIRRDLTDLKITLPDFDSQKRRLASQPPVQYQLPFQQREPVRRVVPALQDPLYRREPIGRPPQPPVQYQLPFQQREPIRRVVPEPIYQREPINRRPPQPPKRDCCIL